MTLKDKAFIYNINSIVKLEDVEVAVKELKEWTAKFRDLNEQSYQDEVAIALTKDFDTKIDEVFG